MTEHLRRHPEIRNEVIEKPIVLIGAPRTGTTITHHLLSQDDRFRYPITWECAELHPPLDPATMGSNIHEIPGPHDLARHSLVVAPNGAGTSIPLRLSRSQRRSEQR